MLTTDRPWWQSSRVAFAACLAAAGTLAAILGSAEAGGLSPFRGMHATFLGIPACLAFAGMAAAALALCQDGSRPWARRCLTACTLWATAVLAMPVYDLGASRLPLTIALGWMDGEAGGGITTFAGLVAFLMVVPLAAAWSWLWEASRGDTDRAGPTLVITALGPALLMVYVLVARWWGDYAAPMDGLVVALLIALATLAGARVLSMESGRLTALSASLGRRADWVVPGVVLAAYGLLKTHGMVASTTDENIYFYMAADLGQGRWPYVDYFFSHPPLHVLLPGAVMAVTGYSLAVAKLFSAVAGGVAGLAVWAIGRRHMGLGAATVAMVAFLFAAEVLKATTNMTGVNLTVMWMMVGVWASLADRPKTAGVALGLAVCTGFYAIAAVCAVLALGLFRNRGFGTRQAVAFLLVGGGINLVCWLVAGDGYLDSVYRYHGLKAAKDAAMVPLFGGPENPLSAAAHNLGVMVEGKPFAKEIFYHAHLWMAGILAPLVGVAAHIFGGGGEGRGAFTSPRRLWRDGGDGVAGILWLVALALFVEFAMFRELYSFYFTLIYPFCGLLLGYVVTRSVRLAWSGVVDAAKPHGLGRLVTATALLAAFLAWEPWAANAGSVFAGEVESRGQRNEYPWTPAPVLTGLSGVVEALWWKDHRIRGDMERGYHHYLWNKKRAFVTLPEIAAYVAAHSQPHETIAGASTVAPLVALEARRSLAAGEVDTNSKRFKTGLLDEEDYWEAICQDDVRFLVSTGRSWFTRKRLSRSPTVAKWFRPVRVFEDPSLRYRGSYRIVIYERVGTPPIPGRVCRYEGG